MTLIFRSLLRQQCFLLEEETLSTSLYDKNSLTDKIALVVENEEKNGKKMSRFILKLLKILINTSSHRLHGNKKLKIMSPVTH